MDIFLDAIQRGEILRHNNRVLTKKLKENKPEVSCQVVLDHEKAIKRLNRRLGLKNTLIKKLNEQIKELESEKEKQVELNNDGLKRNAEFKEQNRMIKESYNNLKRDNEILKKDYENLEIVQKDLQSANETLNTRFNEVNEKLKTCVHNNEELGKELELSINGSKGKDVKIAELESKIKTLTKENHESNSKLITQESQITLLTTQVEEIKTRIQSSSGSSDKRKVSEEEDVEKSDSYRKLEADFNWTREKLNTYREENQTLKSQLKNKGRSERNRTTSSSSSDEIVCLSGPPAKKLKVIPEPKVNTKTEVTDQVKELQDKLTESEKKCKQLGEEIQNLKKIISVQKLEIRQHVNDKKNLNEDIRNNKKGGEIQHHMVVTNKRLEKELRELKTEGEKYKSEISFLKVKINGYEIKLNEKEQSKKDGVIQSCQKDFFKFSIGIH